MGITATYDLHHQICNNGHKSIPHRSAQRTPAKQWMTTVLCCEFHPKLNRSLLRSPKPTRLQVRQRWQTSGHTQIIGYCVEGRWYKEVHYPLFALRSLVLASTLWESHSSQSARNPNKAQYSRNNIKPLDYTSRDTLLLENSDDVGFPLFSLVQALSLLLTWCAWLLDKKLNPSGRVTRPLDARIPKVLQQLKDTFTKRIVIKNFSLTDLKEAPIRSMLRSSPCNVVTKIKHKTKVGIRDPQDIQGWS